MSNVTHKELLTFSNLSNLDWHFVDLKDSSEEGENILNKLLTPKEFVEGYKDPETKKEPIYAYGEGEEAIAEMRQRAGIAMEYLEKWEDKKNEEGSFLGEWEVVYAADNYKIVSEYLDSVHAINGTEADYPDRNDLKDNEKAIQKLQMVIKGISIASYILPVAVELGVGGKLLNILDDTFVDDLIANLKTNADDVMSRIFSRVQGNKAYWALASFNETGAITYPFAASIAEQQIDLKKEETIRRDLKAENYNTKLSLTHQLDLRDTGFRVVVFKKGNDIVIACRNKERENSQVLPEEFDLLQMVYKKIRVENDDKDYNITFTGFGGGSDLGFLGSLYYKSNDRLDKEESLVQIQGQLFYQSTPQVQGLINYTYHDINSNYGNNKDIALETLGNIVEDSAKALMTAAIFGVAAGTPLLFGLILGAGMQIGGALFRCLESARASKFYNILVAEGFIKENKEEKDKIQPRAREDIIKSLISNRINGDGAENEVSYIFVNTKDGEKIKLRLEDAIYCMYEDLFGLDFNTDISNNLKRDPKTGKVIFDCNGRHELEEKDDIYQIKQVRYEALREEDLIAVHPILDTEEGRKYIKYKQKTPYPQFPYAEIPFNNQKGVFIVNTLRIVYQLQQKFIKNNCDLEYIFPTGKTIKTIDQFPDPTTIEKTSNNRGELEVNEYTFLPYLDADSGNIKPDELRPDYIASVIKSMIFQYEEYHRMSVARSINTGQSGGNDLTAHKYDQQYNYQYTHDFWGNKVNSTFLDIMKEGPARIRALYNMSGLLKFNHYQSVLDKLDEKEIEKYYSLEDKEEPRFEADTIVINPEAASQLEYKYNPADDIIGGELELQAKNIAAPGESDEDKETRLEKDKPENLLSALSISSMLSETKQKILEFIPAVIKERYNFLAEQGKTYDKQLEILKTAEADTAAAGELKEEELVRKNGSFIGGSRAEKSAKEKKFTKKILAIPEEQETVEVVKELEGEISQEKEFKAEVLKDKQQKEILINYSPEAKEDRASKLSLAAGLPNEQFDKAERIYKQEVKDNDRDYKYTLTGYSLGGALSQYAAIMSEGFITNYQAISYDSLGLENCLKFNGNEFLGYQIGILHYLEDINNNNTMKTIYYDLLDEQVIKYDNISTQYRRGKKVKAREIKGVLEKILVKRLELSPKRAREIIEENFNPLIIERKMRLIDRNKEYQNWLKKEEEKDRLIHYHFSDNLPALFLKQAGASYLVDKGLKKSTPELRTEIRKEKIKNVEQLAEDNFKPITAKGLDLFQPYLYLKEEKNNKWQERINNRLDNSPQIGNMTNKLSQDYLQALIKDIVLDLTKKDENILKELFKRSRRGHSDYFLEIIKDRLRHSMKSQKKLAEDERVFKSSYLQENPELLTERDKVYPLAQAALEQMEEMNNVELQDLYNWEIRGDGIELILCPQKEEEETKVIEYHSSDSALKFDNQEKRLKLECHEPSSNRIYGSSRQNKYIPNRDREYLVVEDDLYQFNNTRGVGFTIFSPYTSPEKIIKIDGITIDKQYEEIDRDEANIGKRTKTLRDSYFGQNIILRDKKSIYGEPCGELIYIYGPNKKDELIIEGFQNGDYGIKLREKVRPQEEKTAALTYTEHQLKIEPFEFAILNKFKISREIYQHSVLEVQGVIKKENRHKYYQYLREQEDPTITVTYDNDDRKILFKGIIEEFGLGTKENQTHYLRIKAFSYSKLLARRRRNRVFQNMGTSYQEVFDKIKSQNPEFHIDFADTSVASTPLINEDYPVVIQYKESEWDFIKRLATYVNQILIVDDTKDNQEIINIQAGPHNNVAQELNNIAGGEGRKTGRKNTKYKYYRIKEHEHYRSDNIFQIGKKVNYRVSSKTKETLELIIIKNLIYLKNQRLCSDLIMVKEEDIKLVKEIREKRIEGRSFRAEIVKVNNKYQAKVRFIDLEDDFQEDKAHWFPIDRIYTNAFIAPEIGDIVDIYFKARNEKYASVGKATRDEKREINHDPADKMIKTPGGYQIRLNNQSVLFAAPKMSSKVELKEKEINLESNGSSIKMAENIKLKADKAFMLIHKDVLQFGFGGNGIKVKDGEINIS
ncbi:contractile injection system protein, VgrG/Pvc8 family [Halocella sp. SP3-1]|uniref:contractile injection system protein, VgrG/Pvc8 family n=1 Tax=Halocella sp. SP3-1 TaxID=2382161 RepID=UPI000F7572DD|nr:contractile injection system protein, VgrG/Pvc8 family [Halocella sp. SP3-1]AZO95803.1 hypothetical protein D7D81_15075 [Halocella sp. SP3-1]